MAARTKILGPLIEPAQEEFLEPVDVTLPGGENDNPYSLDQGVLKTENADGSADFDFNPDMSLLRGKQEEGFNENLANKIGDGELSRIASELLDAIENDNQSRQEWLQTRARGITLLGLKLEEPRGDVGTSSAPLEGMSTVRHPLLLEATLRFQATARGELLPAAGPVKVRNDATVPPRKLEPAVAGAPALPSPQPAPMGGVPLPPGPTPQGPIPPMPMPPGMPPGPPPPPAKPDASTYKQEPDGMSESSEELASALETDMNHYLTAVDTQYYPDTDRMLFYVGFGGSGFKKIYNCPIRQRPVSDSVDASDLIVSNAAVDIWDVGRLTHRIKMRPSILRRMQLIGAYRDVEISSNQVPQLDPVEQKKAEVQGIKPQTTQSPKDIDHEIFETYCELNIVGFEHKEKGTRGKETGLQLPYKVTIHKESRQVLEIRRNWKENDALCRAKQFFVDFPFVRGLGFYGIGLIHILGNTTNTLTAAWREMLDAGMFANFPGFIYAKQVGRQLTNQFRVPPGGGIALEVGTGKIQDNIMALPYKEVGASFTGFISHVEEVGQRVGGTADANVGEGKSEAPVGTTLALIEQATKVMDAVHKNLHTSQAREFMLLKERFKDDPESFWRHNKKTTLPWRKEQFLKALEDNNIVPVADPNNPTSLHRIAKATAIKSLQQASPQLYDPTAIDMRIMRLIGVDPTGLFKKIPDPPPPDPRFSAIEAKAAAQKRLADIQEQVAKINAVTKFAQFHDNEQERASRERIAQIKIELEAMEIQEKKIIHDKDLISDHVAEANKLDSSERRHQQTLEAAREKHTQKLEHDKTKHKETLEIQREKNKAIASKPKAKTTTKK